MKIWWTRAELLAENLPGLGSNAAVTRASKQLDWKGHPNLCRKRPGRGGGQEVHIDLLPDAARIALEARDATTAEVDLEDKREAVKIEFDRTLSKFQQEERDARLAILAMIDRFAANGGHSYERATKVVSEAYNNGTLPVDGWIKDAIPTISRSSLYRWRQARDAGDFDKLAVTDRGNRKNTGVLDTANGGAVRIHILGLLGKNKKFSADVIRKNVIKKFGKELEIINGKTGEISYKPVPALRTFQHTLNDWKETYKNELLRIWNPDGHKGSSRFVLAGGASAGIHRLNQLWEIDASPADVMCVDGRKNIYACTDVWSRRTIILVSDTPRASAVGLLVRNAIREWGVPEIIKSDNGSDFVAKQTKRLLAALSIEHDICPPFSPEDKPHVERAIRTYNHGLARLLPGFIGHNVADRSEIENRRRFSERLGIKDGDLFNVELTAAELQDYSSRWATDVYGNNPHGGLNGLTPNDRAASSTVKIKSVDEQALDVLLAPIASGGGLRTVTKSGIRLNNEYYLIGNVLPGETVFCRMDPTDLGRVWVYDENGDIFLGHAVCPAIAGLDPVKTIREVRKLQKAVEDETIQPIRREMRKIGPRDVVNAVLESERAEKVVPFKQPDAAERTQVTTRQLEAAKASVTEVKAPAVDEDLQAAMDAIAKDLGAPTPGQKPEPSNQAAAVPNTVRPIKAETEFDRFKRARQLEQRVADGLPLSENDQRWLASYRTSQEYRAMSRFAEDFGGAFNT